MTEKALERGIYLADKIKKLGRGKEGLEQIRNECTENACKEHGLSFYIKCIDNKGGQMTACISVSSAKVALDAEIKIFSKELEEMKKEFAELH